MRLFPATLAVALLVLTATPATAATEVDYFAFLHHSHRYSHARGDSEFERQGTQREVEVTVTGIRSLAGRRVTVRVSRHKVGRMRVSHRGRAHREWSTAHGQQVPRAGSGSSVTVRTAGGRLVASGRYRLDSD